MTKEYNIDNKSVIFIAGHNGMVGSAIMRLLTKSGFGNLIVRSKNELDLTNQMLVKKFFRDNKIDVVVDAAAKVGGILANYSSPYDFINTNLLIQNNLINSALETGVKKFIFLGSSCIYPKHCPQPIREDSLLSGYLEETNEMYAIAKIAGVKMCQAIHKEFGHQYISLMPTNLYGPNDNFNLSNSHVLPALIRKFHEASISGNQHTKTTTQVEIWGTGEPLREFLHVDDLASAVLFTMMSNMEENLYNVGSAEEISIHDLALKIKSIIASKTELIWDSSKPNGTPRKLLDSSKLMNLGWKPLIDLETGIRQTYKWFTENQFSYRN